MKFVLIVCLSIFCLSLAAPAVKYDQRQEGDVNIRADLENFVILIIPTSGTANMGLLDLFTKSIPGKLLNKHHNNNNKNIENRRQSAPLLQTDQHFIESKSAPYHVDISRTRSHLSKLHPQIQQITTNGEILIAHSPTISLSKQENSVLKQDSDDEVSPKSRSSRSSRTLRIDPNEDFQALVLTSDLFVGRKTARGDKKNGKEQKRNGENLTLLGAEMDQCGPDQKRDDQGICQLIRE